MLFSSLLFTRIGYGIKEQTQCGHSILPTKDPINTKLPKLSLWAEYLGSADMVNALKSQQQQRLKKEIRNQ
jgi:hypothetical protein